MCIEATFQSNKTHIRLKHILRIPNPVQSLRTAIQFHSLIPRLVPFSSAGRPSKARARRRPRYRRRAPTASGRRCQSHRKPLPFACPASSDMYVPRVCVWVNAEQVDLLGQSNHSRRHVLRRGSQNHGVHQLSRRTGCSGEEQADREEPQGRWHTGR